MKDLLLSHQSLEFPNNETKKTLVSNKNNVQSKIEPSLSIHPSISADKKIFEFQLFKKSPEPSSSQYTHQQKNSPF